MEMKANYNNSSLQLLVSFFICLILLMVAGYLLNLHTASAPSLEELKSYFIPERNIVVAPEPQERFLFVSLTLLLPLLSLLAIKLTLLWTDRISANHRVSYWLLSLLTIPFLFIFLLYHNVFIIMLTLKIMATITKIIVVSLITLVCSYLLLNNKSLTNLSRNTQAHIINVLAIAAIIIQTLTWRTVGLYQVALTNPWIAHFDAVFYSISQVVAGKTLLSDLPAQYGLYAELLKPIFSIIGLSVFKFTLVMGCLQLTAMIFIWQIIRRHIKLPLLQLICILSLCLTTALTWKLLNTHYWDFYLAYSPIRFFFPCLTIFLLAKFIQKKSVQQIFILALVTSIAILWNLDSGIPAFGTFVAYLASFLLFPQSDLNRKQAMRYLAYVFATFIACTLLFLFYLFLKANSPLQLEELFKYQKIFYLTGFAMLPMPQHFDTWQLVLACYVFGVISFFSAKIKRLSSPNWDIVFCLSILGIGLFSYYQGRSHYSCLSLVCWPAILLAFIYTDKTLGLIRKGYLPKIAFIFCLPILSFGIFTAADYVYGVPTLVKFSYITFKQTANKPETILTKNLAFIKDHLDGAKEAGIWLANQAVYLGELHIASPFKGPGMTELVLQTDYENLLDQINSGTAKLFFVQLDNNLNFPELIAPALKNYRIIEVNRFGVACLKYNSSEGVKS